ncbi:TnsA-like heteromeric transposase endonuclease subunit [Streptomyces sp. NPDC048669]|uniref:TnsA-like heteromeric transposase endonuclease subunit n=1 Tax=Streptomyces sp. NPDC048669 TaxID=3155267 RepID=UPI0034172C87
MPCLDGGPAVLTFASRRLQKCSEPLVRACVPRGCPAPAICGQSRSSVGKRTTVPVICRQVLRCSSLLWAGQSRRFYGRFPSFRGQGNWCGWYWSATCGGHVGYESWLERDHLMLLDFDPWVTAVASQPFQLSWSGPDGKRVRHTPDFFVRRADGTVLVVDVRPDERIEPRDAMKFATTAAACGLVGWDFARLGAPDAVLMENVRWLAGYRHPRVHRPQVAERLMEVFGEGASLLAGARRVGDQIAVVLFHLL